LLWLGVAFLGLLALPAGAGAEEMPPTATVKHFYRVKHGGVVLQLRCRGDEDCNSVVTLVARFRVHKSPSKIRRLPIGQAAFNVPTGTSRLVHVRLNRRGRKRFEAAGPKGVVTTISGPEVPTRTVRLRPANH